MLPHSCEDYQKHQYAASDVLTIVGEDYQDIYKIVKSRWHKGALVKAERTSHKLNDAWDSALLTKITNDVAYHPGYIENMPEPEWHICK